MSTEELLRIRAERGDARGSTTVWRAANRAVADGRGTLDREPREPSRGPFRTAVAVAAIVVLGAMFAAPYLIDDAAPPSSADRVGEADAAFDGSSETDESGGSDEVGGSEEAVLPDPILIEGMELEMVIAPLEGAGGGGASIFHRAVIGEEVPVDRGDEAPPTLVFADLDQPFDGPIVVIQSLVGGGFRTAGANLDEAELRNLSDGAIRGDGPDDGWGLSPETGLAEVAQLGGDIADGIDLGWQLDFASGAQQATIQAEPAVVDGPWQWLARLLLGYDGALLATTESIEVLGEAGIAIGTMARNEEIVWSSGENVYRLTAGVVRSDTHEVVSASPYVDRLRLVDRAEWSDAVDRASARSVGELIGEVFQLVGLGVLVLGGLLLIVVQRRWWLGAGALAAALTFLFFATASSAPLMALLLFVVGVAWLATNGNGRLRDQPDLRDQ